MATAQFLPNEQNITDIEFETQIGDEEKTRSEVMLDSLLTSLNDVSDNSSLTLYRQNGTGKETMVFLEKLAPDKYNSDDLLEHIRDSYGTGDYRIQVRVNGKLRANKLVSVEAPANAVQTSDGSLVSVITQMMQEQAQRQNQMIEQLTTGANTSKADFLKEMMIYKQLFSNDNTNNNNGLGQVTESINFLQQLGVNVGGEQQEKEEGFGEIVAPLLGALMQTRAETQAQPQQTQQRPRNKNDMMKQAMKKGVQQLLKAAVKKSDPAIYADMIVDQYDEKVVSDFIIGENSLERLVSLVPAVMEHSEWFIDLGEHIKGIYGLESKFSDQYTDEADLKETTEAVIKGEILEDTGKNDVVHTT